MKMFDEKTCPVCDEEHSGEWQDAHELIRQIQPSDYALVDFYARAIQQLQTLGASELTDEQEEALEEGEFASEVLEEVTKTLPAAYVVVEDEDYWSVWKA